MCDDNSKSLPATSTIIHAHFSSVLDSYAITSPRDDSFFANSDVVYI